MAVFVLGAGATRGCSFVNAEKYPCLPPLDADFFTQLQRIQNSKHQARIKAVVKDAVSLFGTNFQITLEQMYTTIEHAIAMVDATGVARRLKESELEKMRDRLEQTIAAVLEDSLAESGANASSKHKAKVCKHHMKLVESILKKKDTLISFNYDCVIDSCLRDGGRGKWSARYGYGFSLGARGKLLSGDAHWSPSVKANESQTIRLYKLHGSLHFQFTPKRGNPDVVTVKLKQLPYKFIYDRMDFSIIPPAWNKAYQDEPFRTLWGSAAAALRGAAHLVFIGYSMPTTDLHASSLFRTTIAKPLKSLVVVNPDKVARVRIRSTLESVLNADTRVLSFEKWPEFLACDRGIWDQP